MKTKYSADQVFAMYTVLMGVAQVVQRFTNEYSKNQGNGICILARHICHGRGIAYYGTGGIQEFLEEMFTQWPEYSGIPHYPIPSTIPDLTAGEIYMFMADVWDRNTSYGAKRREALTWLIYQVGDMRQRQALNGDNPVTILEE